MILSPSMNFATTIAPPPFHAGGFPDQKISQNHDFRAVEKNSAIPKPNGFPFRGESSRKSSATYASALFHLRSIGVRQTSHEKRPRNRIARRFLPKERTNAFSLQRAHGPFRRWRANGIARTPPWTRWSVCEPIPTRVTLWRHSIRSHNTFTTA